MTAAMLMGVKNCTVNDEEDASLFGITWLVFNQVMTIDRETLEIERLHKSYIHGVAHTETCNILNLKLH